MKNGIFDEALKGIEEIIDELSSNLSMEFKGTKPFDYVAMPEEEQYYHYQTDGENIFRHIADTEGVESGIQWINDMEKLRGKFNG